MHRLGNGFVAAYQTQFQRISAKSHVVAAYLAPLFESVVNEMAASPNTRSSCCFGKDLVSRFGYKLKPTGSNKPWLT